MPTIKDTEGVKPVNTRSEEERAAIARQTPDAPSPETSAHYAIPQAALTRGVRVKNAHAHNQRMKEAAGDWLIHHQNMAKELGGSAEITSFFTKGYEAQLNGADDWLTNELAAIDSDYTTADKKALVFFTGTKHIPESELSEAWAFEAPVGFGDLSLEQQATIALAGKGK